jgi:ABC-type glycerol-3-phosphate transport system substrate-binding protein
MKVRVSIHSKEGYKMQQQPRNGRELSRRAFLQVAAAGLGGMALAACTVPVAPPAAPAAEGGAAPAGQKLPIIYWSMFGLQEAEQAQAQVDRFNEETGESAIFMSIGWGNIADKVQVAIEGGNPPDMVTLWSQAYTWGPRGLLQPLEAYAERDGWDGKGWSPAAWQALWSEGHLWGTGHTINASALHINLAAAGEAGFSADDLPKTFDDLDGMAEALTKYDDGGNLTRLGFLPWRNAPVFHWLWSNGASMYDEENDKITADNEQVLQVLQWYKSYADKYDIEKIDRFVSGFGDRSMLTDDPWYVDKVGMQIDGSWKRSWIPKYAPEMEYTVIKSPYGPQGTEPISLNEIGAMFNVPTGAKNPEGGWQLAKFMAGKQQQIEFAKQVGNPPPLIEAARDPEFLEFLPYNEVFIELTEGTAGRAWPRIPVLSTYQDEMTRLVNQVTHGEVDPQQGLVELTAKVQKELDDFRKQTAAGS